VTSDDHARLYQHVYLDHSYDHYASKKMPVTLEALEWTHEHEHRIGHYGPMGPHLVDEIPARNLDVAPPAPSADTVES